jgi:lysophospholipase L1-like esterase
MPDASPPTVVAEPSEPDAPPSPRARTRWYQKLLLSVISVSLFIGLAELVCRALDLAPPKRPPFKFIVRSFENDVEYPFMVEDPVLLWAPRPGFRSQESYHGAVVEINSAGFRDREYPAAKAPGTFRILCLGDSTTFGFGVPVDATYPSLLEEMLNGEGRASGVRYEVINGGVTGYSSAQCLLLYQHRARKLHPDLVLLNVGGNDFRKRYYLSDDEILSRARPGVIRRIDDGLSHLHSYRALHQLVWGPPGYGSGDPANNVRRVGLEAFQQNIVKLQESCRADGCRLVLVSFTHCGQIPWANEYTVYDAVIPRYREALEAVARERHIPLATVPVLTERATTPNLRLFADKFHPNEEGHLLLARGLHQFLADNGCLPEASPSSSPAPTP